jgi:ABC-type antimicrobial peptide transport system permease subunit
LLVLTAVLTLLVALAALVLLVVGERFEDSDELYTWEANGVAPGALRQALWIRAVLVTVLAVPLGVLGGLILTRLTARLVDVTAGAQHSQPPLVPVTGLETALPAVLIGLIVALAAAGLVALTSFREPLPVPGSGRAR